MRYRTHLQILDGSRRIVIGTRSAVFAPVTDLALIAVWDDGDDVLVEPQTPGWHARGGGSSGGPGRSVPV